MNKQQRAMARRAALCLCVVVASAKIQTIPAKEKTGMTKAKGGFEVKMTPQKDQSNEAGRMLLDKQFHGDLEAVGQGQMLSAMTDVQGSAGYVAIEKVTGTLHGRQGSFVLQHSSTMARGVPQQNITVIPDSGTDALAGLSGAMTIIIAEGKHFYEFDYSLKTSAA
jgi:hypothetical protein